MINVNQIIVRLILNKLIFYFCFTFLTPSILFAGNNLEADYFNKITGVVEDIYIVQAKRGHIFKYWCIVVTVKTDQNNEFNVSEKIKFYVISTYKTFGSLNEQIIGKKNIFYLYDAMVDNQYDGKLKIRPTK